MKDWILANGYRFSGVHSGLRPDPDRLDLALIVSDRPAAAAGVYTQNRVCAAPVHLCRERLPAPMPAPSSFARATLTPARATKE